MNSWIIIQRIALMSLFIGVTIICTGQIKYAITGTYKGKSAQGMAIWDDRAYLFSHGGRCRVLNLKTEKVEREFLLASSDTLNHVNNACFSKMVISGSDTPLLYISECKNKRRCFVECLNDSSSNLVQTIDAVDDNNEIDPTLDWIVDRENNLLYSITRSSMGFKKTGIIHNYITKYRLPDLSQGPKVSLNVADRLDRYDIPFVNVLQGAKIKNEFMYVVTGLNQPRYEVSKNAERAIIVIDLVKKKLIKIIDLTYVTTNEPEDIDFYDGKCLLYCGQNGGIYEVNLNE